MRPFRILQGAALPTLRTLSDRSVHCCVTSPPYWGLRSYLSDGHPDKAQEIGSERTPEEFVARLVDVFREVRRVLRDDGTLWLNLGDCYATGAGSVGDHPGGGAQGAAWAKKGAATQPNRMPIPGLKPKDLVGIPWRVAFALQADGWWLRSDVIWSKPNPMPESVTDRPTKAHEYLFLLTKSATYFYDHEAVKEAAISTAPAGNGFAGRQGGSERVGPQSGGEGTPEAWASVGGTRNRRSVWTIPTAPYAEAHFAVMPPALVEPCIKAGCPIGGTVLDPFSGAGTVALVATRLQRHAIGIELSAEYVAMSERRIVGDAPLFNLA